VGKSAIYLIWLISKGLLKGLSARGLGGLFVFGENGLAKMAGRGRLEAFVTGWLFWFYFVSGEVKERDLIPARLLNILAGALVTVEDIPENLRKVDHE
jgi:hypothetical protein